MTIIIIGIAAFLLYVLQLEIFKRFWDKNLSVTLSFEDHSLQEGEKGWLRETIENRKRLPLPMLKVKFQCSRELQFSDAGETAVTDFYYRNDIFTVMPYQKITRRLEFTGKKRGYYSIRGIDLVGADLFLSKEIHKQEKTDTICLVYPKPLDKNAILPMLRQMQGELASRRQYIEDPFEYRGIREYQPFDELKQVNWKATAKTGELKVNERGYTTRQGVRIFLNLTDDGVLKHEDALEDTIRLCVTLCMELLASGNRVAVYANSVDCITGESLQLNANTGKAHLENILRGLARLDTSKKTVDFAENFGPVLEEGREQFLTLFLSPNMEQGFQKFVQEYGACKGEYRWLWVTGEKNFPTLLPGLEQYATRVYVEGD